MLQYTIWNVPIPAGYLCVVEGEYRSDARLMRGCVWRTASDGMLLKGSPSLEFGLYRGKSNWPSARAAWQDRVNFRFVGFAVPGSARTCDSRAPSRHLVRK